MAREITVTDTTIRDGHQSLWATRMPTAMMLPLTPHLRRANLACVDVMSHACFSSAVRYLAEHPYDRIRAIRAALPESRLAGSSSGRMSWGFKLAPRDVLTRDLELHLAAGIDSMRFVNGLLDMEMLVDDARHAKALGATTVAALVFSESPVHTDELYESRAREIVTKADVDMVMIKDSGGLLTPERTASLVAAVRRAAGERPITLHSHCMTGMAPRVYMVGVEAGVDDVQCGIWPLALGTAQPSMLTTVRNLREAGYQVPVVDAEIEAASAWLAAEARRRGLPLGRTPDYDHFHYAHQVPGGMLTNLQSQLTEAGLLDRLEEVLHETARVRAELGWPTMVTPYSQFVVSQALLNVVDGERYRHVPDQIKMYVYGYYGAPLGPIDPDVLDRIVSNGSREIAERRPEPDPALPGLRRRHPGADDEELILRYLCPENAVDEVYRRRAERAARWAAPAASLPDELVNLLTTASQLGNGNQIVVDRGSIRVRVVT